jgi:HEAT repeat protein
MNSQAAAQSRRPTCLSSKSLRIRNLNMLEQALEALKTYDWGKDPKALRPIDAAIIATHGDTAKRRDLEDKLTAALKAECPLDAKQVLCRYLMAIGSEACVPTLAAMLSDKDLSHMARYALERIPAQEAAAALRDALPKLSGALKVGVISSLGARQDQGSVSTLSGLLGESDVAVATAAAHALGAIRTPEAAAALSAGKTSLAATDASFSCAEAMLAAGKNADALAIYKKLLAADQRKHVRLAATRGMLACSGKKE